MNHHPDFITVIRSFVFAPAYFIWGVIASAVAYAASFIPDRKILVEVSAIWALGVSFLEKYVLNLNYVMRGKENFPPPPFIAAIQHQSAWETPKVLYWFKDSAVVMKAELLELPLWGRAATRYGSIGVARSKKLSDLHNFIALAKERAADKRNIVLFPQGTRTPPGAPVHLQKGFAVLYRELGIPVVPITLDSGKYWGKGAVFKFPGTVQVAVHPPIMPGLPAEELLATLKQIYEAGSPR